MTHPRLLLDTDDPGAMTELWFLAAAKKQQCQQHNRTPDASFQGLGHNCYGTLWQCIQCKRLVCAGYSVADDQPDKCDGCWTKDHTSRRRT